MAEQTSQATLEELRDDALNHYDELSTKACHWLSSVPNAINGHFNSLIKQRDGKMGDVSDGHHTFDELYEIRKAYNVALFNFWANTDMGYSGEGYNEYDVHKSWRHHNGEECFGGGWFIVVAILPDGQISNHYPAEDWDLFKVPEEEKAKYPFDGHTTKDVIERLINSW